MPYPSRYYLFKMRISLPKLLQYHSRIQSISHTGFKVKILPALQDNYMFLIMDEKTKTAGVIDPVEPAKVLEAVHDEDVDLTTVLMTHHHWDHAGGNKELLSTHKHLKVFGFGDHIFGVNHKVTHNCTLNLGSLYLKCLFTPCHTMDHISYYIDNKDDPALFSGDTLFLGGCGRFFEGTGEDMYNSLINVISKLPGNTKVYCGHEYSVSNLLFAVHSQPNNKNAIKKLEWAKKQRIDGIPTIPSTLEEEFLYNPFLCVNKKNMQRRYKTDNGIETMTALRLDKDNFKSS